MLANMVVLMYVHFMLLLSWSHFASTGVAQPSAQPTQFDSTQSTYTTQPIASNSLSNSPYASNQSVSPSPGLLADSTSVYDNSAKGKVGRLYNKVENAMRKKYVSLTSPHRTASSRLFPPLHDDSSTPQL